MEILSIIIQFFDLVLSAIISAVNIVLDLWREILIAAAIIIAALIFIRVLRAVRSRSDFVKRIKRAAKENGVKLNFRRPATLSLFWNFRGYDIEFDLRGVIYRIKFYPWIVRGKDVHITSGSETLLLGRLAYRRAISRGILRGIKVKLDFDRTVSDNTVNILLFSPSPLAVTERNESGTVWELDTENGRMRDGIYIFTDDILKFRLPRLIDGYIDGLVHVD